MRLIEIEDKRPEQSTGIEAERLRLARYRLPGSSLPALPEGDAPRVETLKTGIDIP